MDIHFKTFAAAPKDVLVVFASPTKTSITLHFGDVKVDKAAVKIFVAQLEAIQFKAKKHETASLAKPEGLPVNSLVVVGLGDGEKPTLLHVQHLGGAVCPKISQPFSHAFIVPPTLKGLKEEDVAANLACGLALRSYRFDKYRTQEKPENKPTLEGVTFLVDDAKKAATAHKPLEVLAENVALARNLQSEPANILYPEAMAETAKKELAGLKVKVSVLDVPAMKKLGMGALLGVGQGSIRDARLIVLEYNGAAKGKAPVALVGKGVTFDTGGISIKPANNMEDMKWDMGGSAVVLASVKALAQRGAAVNVVGVMGMVENMPSGTAQRPGDVVTSMSGQTIEVINTDAEGRLVLADALWYAQTTFKPSMVIDLATLTGAITVALGEVTAGLFSNKDDLADKLFTSSQAVGEPLWRLPMGEEYDKDINCDVADMKNVGSGRGAGSITAAQFLGRFIQEGTPWAHLDIAGVTWAKKDTHLVPKGCTAFGVRLLDHFFKTHIEQ